MDSTLSNSILVALAGAPAPMSSDAIGIHLGVDGLVAKDRVRAAIRLLVQERKIVRHHNGDGILRYSVDKASEPPPAEGDVEVDREPHASERAESEAHRSSEQSGIITAHDAGVEILRRLAAAGGSMRSADLRAQLPSLGPSQWQYALSLLSKSGRVEVERRGQESTLRLPIAPAEKAHPITSAKPKKARTEREGRRDFLAAAEGAASVIKALEFAAKVAQDALDVYLHSVGDKKIIASLTASRDQARDALARYVGIPSATLTPTSR